jgi:acetyl esterase/lipase
VPAYAVPARRTDLTGLPPAWIGVGSIELFYDEDRRYAQALQDAGVDCTLDVVPGAPHAIESFGRNTAIATEFRARAEKWLADRLGIADRLGLTDRLGPAERPEPDFHPDLRRHSRFLPRDLPLPAALRVHRALDALSSRRPATDVTVVPLGPGNAVRLHRPTGLPATTPALLWIHGGGYVLGSAQQDDGLCRRFAAALGITVASVDYRLAPQHPYPAALDDCQTAYNWLLEQAGIDPARMAIGGASAGGGLAAALAIRLHDLGAPAPVLQLLAYPMLDDRTTGSAGNGRGDYRVWGPRSNRFAWAAYLGDADPHTAVPARRDDLTGLAPAWIGVGTKDLFYDEDIAYAGRLTEAGVPCEVERVPGAFHGFDLVAPGAGVSRQFFDQRCSALRKAFHRNDVDGV